jgi:hypothetical protein
MLKAATLTLLPVACQLVALVKQPLADGWNV